MTEASGAGAPKCKLCGQPHWLRVGCNGLQFSGGRLAGKTDDHNTPREGHRVLKGAKPTRSASTESPNPPTPRTKKRKAKRGAKRK